VTAQLTVVRVGPALVGAIPFEATTVAGGMIRRGLDSAGPRDPARRVYLITLANGYNQYVASPAEYDAQHYEGGSTLYGPRTAERLAGLMAGLAAALPQGAGPSPPAEVPRAYGRPGADRDILPRATAGPAPQEITRRASVEWEGDVLVIRWNDIHPGRLVPADGPVLRIDRQTGAAWLPLVWDDDRSVEVRAIGPAGAAGYRWEARWKPDPAPRDAARVVLLPREGLAEVEANLPLR
jgi:neutral ceramidase